MNNKHFDYAKKNIKALARRYKTISYSISLVLTFAMLGVNAFSEEVSLKVNKQEIVSSTEKLSEVLNNIKLENEKKLKGANLELIQLIEQGNQVVKSPWASWQFGINYFYDNWGGSFRGEGDKAKKYPYEGIFTRGEWWERNVSPESKTYERIVKRNNLKSSLTNNRDGYNYGLVRTKKIPDRGTPFVIEPVINIKTPPLPNLNINPMEIVPNIKFTIPDVATSGFNPRELSSVEPNVFNPPALDQVATGFAQDMQGVSFYMEPNVIINNASGNANASGTTVTILDNGFSVDNPFTYIGRKDNQGRSTTGEGTIAGTWSFDQSNPDPSIANYTDARAGSIITNSTGVYNQYKNANHYRTGNPSSPQAVFSFTQYQQGNEIRPGNTTSTSDISGDWTLKNTTSDPIRRNKNLSNTVRFISVNGTHVFSFYDPMVANFNGNLKIYGRSAFDTLTKPLYKNWTHMTVAVEQQAASAKESIFTNNGVITLEREAAKPAVNPKDDTLGSFLIGFAAMIEDYGQYQPVTGNSVLHTRYSDITFRPWASEMNNKGTINVKSVESIGIDFSEFSFEPDAGKINNSAINIEKQKAWGNKGSLRIYMNTGNINVSSIDPGNLATVRGSYGIRVPNIFNGGRIGKTVDSEGIYYDETIIDGENGTVTLTGDHNVGISVSKKIGGSGTGTNENNDTYSEYKQTIITGQYNGQVYNVGKGTMSVYNYQTGKGANGTGLGGKTVDKANLDNTGRTEKDLIGNIYNLNILVDGTENIGFLRNFDYMYGNYSQATKTLAENDFNIKDTHIKSINFSSTANGGVLFRTDRYGINLEKNLTGAEEVNSGNASVADKKYNIVMLANGAKNPNDTVVPKVKNTGNITFAAGGQNLIGLMAYSGGKAEVIGDITITNSPSSLGLVINGRNINRVSEGLSSGNISVNGNESVAIYNNGGKYELSAGGKLNASGEGAIAVYASKNGADLAETKLGAGQVSVSGKGSVALYANGGSNIELNGTNLDISDDNLLFYGAENSKLHLTGDATANIASGGTAFYVKNPIGSPLNSIRSSSSTGQLTVNLADNSTLIVAEGNGGTSGGELLSNLSNSTSTTGIIINGSGNYTPYKAYRLPLIVDTDVDLNEPTDKYLISEFSSSSVTLENGKTISGSGKITSPSNLAKRSKSAIAQKNTKPGVTRDDVVLTNNGTIDLTGTEMVGIVGEFSKIENNNIIKTIGDGSTAIITTNGGIATNNLTGKITVGNAGVGIAGINYLGVTNVPSLVQPKTGEGFIEIVNNGSINSTATKDSAIGILALDLKESADGKVSVTATKASKITLGNKSSIDVSSSAGGVAVYSKAIYRSGAAKIMDNGSKITIANNGVGIFAEGTEIEAVGGSIESINKATAKAVYTDSDIINSKNIKLLGDKSIGIHNYAVNSLYASNKGRNYVKISNSGEITLGDSESINDPSIGIYTKFGEVEHKASILGGKNTVAIYSDVARDVNLINGHIKLKDGALAIYKKQGRLNLDANSTIEVDNNATVAYANNGVEIINNSRDIKIKDNSYGFVILDNGTNKYTSNLNSKFTMNSGSVYLYKSGASGEVNSSTTVNTTSSKNTALFANNNAIIKNFGLLNLKNGFGNIGAFALTNGEVENNSKIIVGSSDIKNNYFAIAMAAQNGGKVVNKSGATIEVTGNYGIGMFAEGAGSRAENHGTIAMVSAGELKGAYGMYLTDGAYGLNTGIIKSGNYNGDVNKEALYGVAVMNGATFENKGTVDIDASNSYGIYIRDAVIKNYGTIKISGAGSVGIRNKEGRNEFANAITEADLAAAGVIASNGAKAYLDETNGASNPILTGSTEISTSGVVTIDGKIVPIHDLRPGPKPENKNFVFSNVGIYIDTLGRTNPINWVDGFNPNIDNDLIIGSEAAEISNARAIKIGRDIITPFIKPYLDSTNSSTKKVLSTISGSLTWTVQPIEGRSGMPEEAILAKIPYTDFVDKTENAWNFTDGLEQRYDKNELGSREKKLFNKLNLIGKNEQALLTQAFDEMMGHQYANIQQRIHSTGQILDK
ncbi:MAG: autotransporter-associated N-terminal domain-containing protein, partial [Fusobacterium sp.]|uniref:autotransporter-associated N-terminal domain-containing protein n=1 Tax=Fusobacterium sp. TaxID=68766 RepID=UPI0026DBC6D5